MIKSTYFGLNSSLVIGIDCLLVLRLDVVVLVGGPLLFS